ncbi:DegV family protein [Spongisporangium articulatum]|uniref:DegV family protein n=1 Tax=Spongisporangium articulatum TaxID=3362603 RepID=A0ABW8AMA6_9ACTN
MSPQRRHIAVVTDSTAYLPDKAADDLHITVVPLQVIFDGRSYAEGVEISSERVARALKADLRVTTSRPSAQAFVDTYEQLRREGASAVVSVHMSGDMSGTVDAARTAARELEATGLQVEVVDSRSLGMGMGFGVLDAARAAAAGASPEEVASAARRRSLHSSIYMYVDTLEYLRRGGRIGAAQALLGSALTIKPLLHLVDGRLEALDRVRTTARALDRLVEVAAQDAREHPAELAVHHLDAPDRAEEVAARLREAVPGVGEIAVSEVGAVVGAHVGPGTVGVVVSPRP